MATTLLLLIVDALAAAAALLLTYMFRFGGGVFLGPIPAEFDRPLLVMTGFWWLLMMLRGMYRSVVSLVRFDEVFNCLKTVAIGVVLIFLITFDFKVPFHITRLFLLTYGALVFLFMVIGRMAVREFQLWLRWKGVGLSRAVIVGFNQVGRRLHSQLSNQPVWGYRVVGFVDEQPSDQEHLGVGVIAAVDRLPEVIQAHRIKWVLIAPEPQRQELPLKVMDICTGLRVRFMIVADYYQMVAGFVRTTQVHGLPLVEAVPQRVPLFTALVKRALDVVLGLVMTALFLALTPPLALAIRLDSPGSIFTSRRRVGRRGREMVLRWFRTTGRDAGSEAEAGGAVAEGTGITRVGRILRRTRLDKLPQYLDVLLGRMSLVGPQAEPPEAVERYRGKIPLYERRFSVRPGVTGWAQIRYRYGELLEDAVERTRYDLYYIDHMSLALDLWMILAGLRRMLLNK